jgi:hypothetical protein
MHSRHREPTRPRKTHGHSHPSSLFVTSHPSLLLYPRQPELCFSIPSLRLSDILLQHSLSLLSPPLPPSPALFSVLIVNENLRCCTDTSYEYVLLRAARSVFFYGVPGHYTVRTLTHDPIKNDILGLSYLLPNSVTIVLAQDAFGLLSKTLFFIALES